MGPNSGAERWFKANFAPPRSGAWPEPSPTSFSIFDPDPHADLRACAQYLAHMMTEALDGGGRSWLKRYSRPPVIRLEKAYVTGQLNLRPRTLPTHWRTSE